LDKDNKSDLKSKMAVLQCDGSSGTGATVMVQRMNLFYKLFVCLAALISCLAVGALTLSEFHPTNSQFAEVAEGCLCSSATTAVIAAVAATMLLFHFEGHKNITRVELAVAWSPLMLLDLAIAEFTVGMASWYCGKKSGRGGVFMTIYTAVLLSFCFLVSSWMFGKWQNKGQYVKSTVKGRCSPLMQ
jgi:hypothetical protein